jgi:spore germination protein YaaH
MKHFRLISLIIAVFILSPLCVSAATVPAPKLSYTAWVPYWAKASGTPDAIAHISVFKSLSPFAYEVEDDGTIVDAMKLATTPWSDLIASATAKKVNIIPSILWIHGDAIHTTLSATTSRKLHEDDILSMVTRNNFAGIDIDYENKILASKYYFSSFIKELSLKLHTKNKLLICTIEARTPPSSLYRTIPKNIEHVNDYVVINKYCDEVRIMTYDQTTADIKLNDSKGIRELYAPVADTDWVKKVITEAAKTISKKKIMLGVATYGYIFKVDMSTATTTYDRMRSISDPDARALALSNGVTLGDSHNGAGERSFNYQKNGATYYVSWSDANAVAAKIKLARSLGIKGVALFKIDGAEDPDIWKVLK